MSLKNVVKYFLSAIVFTVFYKTLKLSIHLRPQGGSQLTESEKCESQENFGELGKIRTVQLNVLEDPWSTRFIYNRIPKCGSTTVNKIFDKLSDMGRFNIHHSPMFDRFFLSERAQNDVCDTIRSVNTPLLHERHIIYFNMMSRCGFKSPPVWINVVRNPIDRYVSHYYFVLFGANDFNATIPVKQEMILDECVKRDSCEFRYNLQLLFFCGDDTSCNRDDNTALTLAKRRIEEEYSIVGISENMRGFFQLLELAFPSFFKGATQIYTENENVVRNASATKKKILPSPETVDILKQKMKYEIELYHFAERHYHKLKCLMESDRVL